MTGFKQLYNYLLYLKEFKCEGKYSFLFLGNVIGSLVDIQKGVVDSALSHKASISRWDPSIHPAGSNTFISADGNEYHLC